MKINEVYLGDAWNLAERLKKHSIDSIVTSPPYRRLRRYGAPGEFGLEATEEEYNTKLLRLFEILKPKLKRSSTVWVNLGDHYEHKQLSLSPWNFLIGMQQLGYKPRSINIWFKPNCKPESVKDRPTLAHEYIFQFAVTNRYYFDSDSVRTEQKLESIERQYRAISNECKWFKESKSDHRIDEISRSRPNRSKPYRQGYSANKIDSCIVDPDERDYAIKHYGLNGTTLHSQETEEIKGANLRTVWPFSTVGTKLNHFATFPITLPMLCILAGTPVEGTVLDPFAGTGTTGLAAMKLQRNFILFEIKPEYVGYAKRRISEQTLALPFGKLR